MEIRDDLKYTADHEWVLIDGETIGVGITDFAQSSLGDIVYVEAPEVGSSFEAGDEMGSIESVKAVADLFSPVAGEVVEVNERLEEEPELLNSNPYEAGWILKMKVTPEALEEAGLLDADGYQKVIA